MSNKKKEPEPIVKPSRMPKVYVVGGGYEYLRLLYNLGFNGAIGLDDADLVLFTGGEDVNPELYGEAPLQKTHFNRIRDDKEKAIYHGALDRELPMVGICRGGQFLNVMNGGKMWQHVNNHTRNHLARIEVPPFVKTSQGDKQRLIEVTSTHHQMMIPTDDAIVLATANESDEKHSATKMVSGKFQADRDTEVVWYADTCCLCFQPHPEFKHAPAACVDFFEECLENWVMPCVPKRQLPTDKEAVVIPITAGDKKGAKKK